LADHVGTLFRVDLDFFLSLRVSLTESFGQHRYIANGRTLSFSLIGLDLLIENPFDLVIRVEVSMVGF